MGKRRISRRQFLEGTGTALTVAVAAPALNAQRMRPLGTAGATTAAPVAGTTGAPPDHHHASRSTARHAGSRSRIAGRSLKRCAITPGSPARKSAATAVSAVRARCCSTASRLYSCSQLAVWADGRTVQTVEGPHPRRYARSPPAVLRRARCAAVRLLHVRSVDEREGAAQRERASHGRRGRARR